MFWGRPIGSGYSAISVPINSADSGCPNEERRSYRKYPSAVPESRIRMSGAERSTGQNTSPPNVSRTRWCCLRRRWDSLDVRANGYLSADCWEVIAIVDWLSVMFLETDCGGNETVPVQT